VGGERSAVNAVHCRARGESLSPGVSFKGRALGKLITCKDDFTCLKAFFLQ